MHEEPEVDFGANDEGFMIKNFGEPVKEASLTNTKMLRDNIYHINYPAPHDHEITINVSPCLPFYVPCPILFVHCCVKDENFID